MSQKTGCNERPTPFFGAFIIFPCRTYASVSQSSRYMLYRAANLQTSLTSYWEAEAPHSVPWSLVARNTSLFWGCPCSSWTPETMDAAKSSITATQKRFLFKNQRGSRTCELVWLNTMSIINFIPRLWISSQRSSQSLMVPNIGLIPL